MGSKNFVATNGLDPYGPKVVFAYANDCPKKSTTFSICKAAEKTPGVTCFGAQERAGLWRIQTLTAIGRIKLLASHMEIDRKLITIHDRNPFLRGDVEDDEPSTRLTITGLPFSYGNDAIERNLTAMGIKCRQKIKMECDKDGNGHLSDYRTGRRVVSINLPEKPLSKTVRMGNFQCELFHWEMKAANTQCRRCLQNGHKAYECPNEEACLLCHLPGHRKGDTACPGKKHDETNITKEKPMGNDLQPRNPYAVPLKRTPEMEEKYPCPACNEYGHEEYDAICPHVIESFGVYDNDDKKAGAAQTDKSEYTLEKELNGKGDKCALCGSTEHHESSWECMGHYPHLQEAGSRNLKCSACNETGHEDGHLLCKDRISGPSNAIQLETQGKDIQVQMDLDAQEKDLLQQGFPFNSQGDLQQADSENEEEDEAEATLTEEDNDTDSSELEEDNEQTKESTIKEDDSEQQKQDSQEISPIEGSEEISDSTEKPKDPSEGKIQKIYPMFVNHVDSSLPENNQIHQALGEKRDTPASSPDGHAVGNKPKKQLLDRDAGPAL